MNRHLHRIVFNAARGMRMVVQETATSTGKGSNKATAVVGGALAGVAAFAPMLVGAALAGMLTTPSVHAQIVGAPNVPGNLRPTVLVAPNGVPLINIQSPSAAGVSRNVYNQLSVGPSGAIFNNSRTNVQTQLGGIVQGNPYLAGGPARIILNEVNGGNVSQLRGYMEVAGQRAEIIIANPAGINVDGAGFINASRATLTTGTPQLNAFGGLESFLVRGGTVTINGAGLDASKTDYAAILARAVEANAGIWASELKVVTGANQVSADHAQITPTTGIGPAPTFALDVAALGGMYAGKIVLLGTEQGLGVRNAGSIGASAGSLVVTASGRLENTGTLEGQSVQLASTGSDIVNRGTIRQTGMAPLALSAPTLSNTSGGWIGSEPVPAPAAGSDSGGTGSGTTTGTGSGGSTGTTTSASGTTTGGTSTPAAAPIEPGNITAAGAIRNDGGKVYAGGPITLQTANLLNNGGTLSVASLALNQESFSNQGGTINVSGAFTARLGSFDNASGTLRSGSLDIATSGDLNNQAGALSSDSYANLTVGGSTNNLSGNISAAGALTANVTGATTNTSGTLASNQGLALSTGSLENTKGSIQSAQAGVQLAVTTALVNGDGGSINTATDLGIQAGSLSNGGTLRGANDVNVTVSGPLANGGSITAGRNTTLVAENVESSAAGVVGAGIQSDGQLATGQRAQGTLRVTATGALVANGTNLAAGDAAFQGASVDLSGKQTSAANIAIVATQGDVTTSKSVITTSGMLSIAAAGALTNVQGVLAANGATQVEASSLDNNHGTLASVTGDLRVTTSGTTDNTSGSLLAAGATVLANSGLVNTDGKISGRSLAVDTHNGTLQNLRGTLTAGSTVDLGTGSIVNDAGLIQSGGAMTIATHGGTLVNTNAAGYSNSQGGIVSADTLHISTGAPGGPFGRLDNGAGFIGSKNALTVSTGEFVNGSGGLVLGQSMLTIDTHGATYDNRGGQTLAVGALQVDAGSIQNAGALIRSSATTTLRAGSVDNTATSGTDQGIEGKNVGIAATTVSNASGAIRADVNVALNSTGLVDNGAGGLVSAGDTVSITDPNAAVAGAKTLSVTNAGTLLAGKTLTVDAASLTSTGKLLSQGDMSLALAQDVTLAAGTETIANHDLRIATSGNIANNGRIAAGNDLSLSATNIDNTATGDIQGSTTHLSATGTVTNRGVIDGVVTRIDAGTLTNIGTGRIYGDQISVGVDTLNNLAETANGTISAATIAARVRLDIGAKNVNNRDGALIFSDGNLAIGGGLDALGRATGSATTINNHAATIEATGNVDIKTDTLNNTNGGVTWALQPGSSQFVVEYEIPGNSKRWKADEVLIGFGGLTQFPDTGWNGWRADSAAVPGRAGSDPYARLLIPSPDYPLDKFRAYYLQSPASSHDRTVQECTVGQDSTCTAVTVPGVWYSRTDPIWATFGVTPPAVDLPMDFIGRRYPDITVGQTGITSWDSSEPPHEVFMAFDHPVTQAEYDQWQNYRQAHKALDKATLAFIYTMTGTPATATDYKPPRFSSTFDTYAYTVTSSTPVLQSSAPGKIIAGGTMTIDVRSGVNDMSQILAGSALTVTGGTILNKGLTVDAPTVQVGTVSHSYVEEHSGDDERVYQFAPYNLTTHSTATLVAARQQGNVAVAVGAPGTGSLSVGQTGAGAQAAGGVSGGTRVNPIIQVPSAGGPGATAGVAGATVVRTSVPNTAVPSTSLFRTLANPSSRYLIETDPRFANYRNWLSSDYLLNNLGLDPNNTLKRLGDGFYEQRLIREQVAQLTGYRYLDGFDSDDAQYTALMNAGVTFAQQYGLRPGIALTDAQMAQLTSDIVWLVEQTVTLPDGSTQRVLVPQVYVRVKPGDIDGSGALLSGRSVDMRLTGDLTNAGGTIAGRHVVSLSGDNINNLAGRITGEDVALTARTDINVIGAVVDASKSLTAVAGRDINVVTTTRDSRSQVGALPRSDASSGVKLGAVTLDRVAGLYVTGPGGDLTAVAGRDMNLVGAEVKSAGDATLVAGRDVNLETVTTGRTEDIRWSSKNSRKNEESKETGTTVSGAGDVSIGAGRNLTGKAAILSAGETLSLSARDQLTLVAGENQASAATKDAQKSGMSHSSFNADSQETTLALTTLTGKNIELKSGGDMTLGAIKADAEKIDIEVGGKLNLLTQKTTKAGSSNENDGDGAWVSAKSNGRSDETSQYNLFNTLNLNIKASGGVTAQLGQNASLSDLAKQPGMAWVNQLASDPAFANSVQWERVQEEHKKWAQSQTSLGPVASVIVSVVVGVATAGAGTAAVGTAAGTTTTAGTGIAGAMGLSATTTSIATAAMQAGITAIASQATISFVNNDGDLGKVFDELGKSQSVKNILTAMITAGAIQGLSVGDVLPKNLANATNGAAFFSDQLQRQLIDGAASAVIRSAINGTSLEDELSHAISNALLNTVAAQGAYAIGDLRVNETLNVYGQQVAHAILGCLVGAGRSSAAGGGGGDGCAAGAIGAVVGELTASAFNPTGNPALADQTLQAATLMSGVVGALVGGSASAGYIAAAAGVNAAENNFLLHGQALAMKEDFAACAQRSGGCSEQEIKDITQRYLKLSGDNITAISKCVAAGDAACVRRLEGDAATASEVDAAIPLGYGDISRVFQGLQNNVNNYGSVRGAQSLFGSDEQQAQEVAQFRQANCATRSAADCNAMVDQAIQDRYARAGILMVTGGVAGAAATRLGGLKVPTTVKTPIKPGVVADDLPPGFTRGSGGNGRVVGDIDPVTGEFLLNTGGNALALPSSYVPMRVGNLPTGYQGVLNVGTGEIMMMTAAGQILPLPANVASTLPNPQALPNPAATPQPMSSLFGQTLIGPAVSHTAGRQTGFLGEDIGLQTLNTRTGLNFAPLQNNSNQGADGVALDHNTRTIYVAEVKSSQNGVDNAVPAVGNPVTLLQGWVGNSLTPPAKSEWKSQPTGNTFLAQSIQDAIDAGYKVVGVQVQVGVPAPGVSGIPQIKINPWK